MIVVNNWEITKVDEVYFLTLESKEYNEVYKFSHIKLTEDQAKQILKETNCKTVEFPF